MAFEVEVLDEMPSRGSLVHFPSDGIGPIALMVRIAVDSRDSWVDVFHSEFEDDDTVTSLDTWPESGLILAVSGGTGFTLDYTSRGEHSSVPIKPVLHRIEHPAGMVILGNHCYLAGYSANGLVWTSKRLSWDGLRDLSLVGSEIQGLAFDAANDAWIEFRINARTGVQTSGRLSFGE